MGTKQGLILLLVTFFIFLTITIGTTSAVTITVDDDGGADYTSIQDAVNNATKGDTILVYPGMYYENVVVDKQLNITSTDGASVTHVIAASAFDHVFYITADGVTINGFNVSGATGSHEAGIQVFGSSYNKLTNNNISNNRNGIYLSNSCSNILTNNTAARNYNYGIVLSYDCNDNLIYNNLFNNDVNAGFNGINIHNEWNIEKTAGPNIMGGPYLGGNCWEKPDGTGFSQTYYDADFDGICDGSYVVGVDNMDYGPLTPYGGVVTVDDSGGADYTSIKAAIDASNTNATILVYPGTYIENVNVGKQLKIMSTDGASVTHVIAASAYDHVFEIVSDNVTISGFNISGASEDSGIYGSSLHNVILANNNVAYNTYGIHLYGSAKNKLLNNNVVENSYIGIELADSGSNTLINNTVAKNSWYGIRLWYSNNHVLTNNNAVNNNFSGIYLRHSDNNKLTNNIIAENINEGIYLSYYSNDNLIYNNFFNNSVNAKFYGYNTGNVWNTTKTEGTNIAGGPYLGGNYWATPNGTGFSQTHNDTDSDGICNSYYTIVTDPNSIDKLPLRNSIYTVDDGGGADYTTIQAAVNAAIPGATVLVYPGTYVENVNVDKRLNITSTDGAAVTNVIAASTNDHVFEVTADGVKINGFNVSGATYYYKAGICLHYSDYNTLTNNSATNNYNGIFLWGTSNSMLANNNVSKNRDGIYLHSSTDNTLINNNALNNSFSGIYLRFSSNNFLTNNKVSLNADDGILLSGSNNNILTNNSAAGNDVFGIVLEYSNNNMIYNNIFNNSVNTDFIGDNTGNMWIGGTMKLLLNDDEKHTIRTGSSFKLPEGYALNIKQITVEGDKVWMEFSKDGVSLGDEVIDVGSGEATWNYEAVVGDHEAIILFRVLVTDVFQNQVDSLVVVEGLWLIENTLEMEYNIVGGPYLGGNYWATPDNNGFSQTNADTDEDGFCDSPLNKYELAVSNIDYLPLSTTLTITGSCPIDIEVVDPEGFLITKQTNQILGATYREIDINGDGDLNDIVSIPNLKQGNYQIEIIPEQDAEPSETYTLEVSLGGTTLILDKNVPASNIPNQPYNVKITAEREISSYAYNPSINIEKSTNGMNADNSTGPQIIVGDTVTWTYNVTNTGNVNLIDINVTDSKGIEVNCPKTTLEPGESMTCTAIGIAELGQYSNYGNVTAMHGDVEVQDSDLSHYFGYGKKSPGFGILAGLIVIVSITLLRRRGD
ncbi:NosD domain-containing protein [Methanolobus sediminis]|uniref:NosD domain-containing protein n=1 Tax=Methanolobus sediminis TaxID=3072978 RepID=A0AA51YLG5_9EURY|nr:NosD domain-containing protein [Methanolobus sediminis]WMW24959.1 NosD domain-containing protein [Methanolobus sediminis]